MDICIVKPIEDIREFMNGVEDIEVKMFIFDVSLHVSWGTINYVGMVLLVGDAVSNEVERQVRDNVTN